MKDINVDIKISKEEELNILEEFAVKYDYTFRSGRNLYRIMINEFEEELGKIEGLNKKERKELFNKFLEREYKKRIKTLENKTQKFEKAWRKIEPDFFRATEELFQHKFPSGNYTGFITIFGICPRDIEKKKFQIRVDRDVDFFVLVIMHELLHFMYFDYMEKKFNKELKTDLEWDLSEILNVILLNKNPYNKWTNIKSKPYPKHKERYAQLDKIYKRSASISDFIEKAIVFLKAAPEN